MRVGAKVAILTPHFWFIRETSINFLDPLPY